MRKKIGHRQPDAETLDLFAERHCGYVVLAWDCALVG